MVRFYNTGKQVLRASNEGISLGTLVLDIGDQKPTKGTLTASPTTHFADAVSEEAAREIVNALNMQEKLRG